MHVILISGFWLQGDSWATVTPALVTAGHQVLTPTLPGKESATANREGVGLRTHIDAVTAIVDSLDGPVALVGHSGGGAISHGVADARPDRIARVVYVDSGPLGEGAVINDDFESEDHGIPLPDWGAFEDEELTDLDDALRAEFRRIAVPEPVGVATEPQHLHDERRYDVPVTIISCTMPRELLEQFIAGGHPYVAELARIPSREIVELPTGHWPQLTKPHELAQLILAALR